MNIFFDHLIMYLHEISNSCQRLLALLFVSIFFHSRAILGHKKFLTALISGVIGNSGVIFLDYQKMKNKVFEVTQLISLW